MKTYRVESTGYEWRVVAQPLTATGGLSYRVLALFRLQVDAEQYASWKNGLESVANAIDYTAGRHPSTEVEDDCIDSPVQDSKPPAILPPAGWQHQPIPQQESKAIKFREFL